MHELSLCEALIDQVGQEIERCGQTGRIIGVEVAIGRLSGVHPESFRFAFRLLAPGTCLDGAQLNVTEPKAICHCCECHARVEIDELLVECPQCGSASIAFDGGRELLLQSIEIED